MAERDGLNPPEGYRMLNPDEPTEPGDLWSYVGLNARWLPSKHERQKNNIYCRKLIEEPRP